MTVEFSNDTFSTVFRQTIHGPGIDEPLAIIGDRPGEYTYYLHDGLGSVTALVDAAGNLDGCYDYGAFGDERHNTVMIENRYRYTSREYVEPNLYYYRARYMRPDLGRFVSMDPLKMTHGTNMFIYVVNDPMHWVDPWGLKELPNGNARDGYEDQDWKCSSIFRILNPSPCHKKCCIEHDRCYKIYGCNQSSWRYFLSGATKPCWFCNHVVVLCFTSAAKNPDCYICAVFDNLPTGPGPGPYPGGPGGPQWN